MKYYSSPIEVGLEVTNQCNLSCLHCYASSSNKRLQNELSADEIKHLIDRLSEMKVFRVFIGGGEPFLRSDTLEIIEYAKNKGLAVVVSTNGCFLNEEKVRSLKKFEVDDIQVSIDGATSQTHDFCRGVKGSFEMAIRASKLISANGVKLSIGTTLNRYNVKELSKIIELSIELKATTLHIMGIQPGGRGAINYSDKALTDEMWIDASNLVERKRKELDNNKFSIGMQGARFAYINKNIITPEMLKEDLNEIDLLTSTCQCAKARCVIDPIGNVLACDMLRISDSNIRDEDIEYIWNNSKLLNSIRNRNAAEIEDCKSCSFCDICSGGCPAATFNTYKDFMRADPRCKISMKLISK